MRMTDMNPPCSQATSRITTAPRKGYGVHYERLRRALIMHKLIEHMECLPLGGFAFKTLAVYPNEDGTYTEWCAGLKSPPQSLISVVDHLTDLVVRFAIE